MWYVVSVFKSFKLLNSIFCMDKLHFVYLFTSWWIISNFCLLWKMLLWTFTYMSLCRHVFMLLWYIPWSRIAGPNSKFIFRLKKKSLPNDFPKWLYHLRFPTAIHKGSSLFTFLPTLVLSVFLIVVILVGVLWYVTVVLIEFFWGLMMLNIFWVY